MLRESFAHATAEFPASISSRSLWIRLRYRRRSVTGFEHWGTPWLPVGTEQSGGAQEPDRQLSLVSITPKTFAFSVRCGRQAADEAARLLRCFKVFNRESARRLKPWRASVSISERWLLEKCGVCTGRLSRCRRISRGDASG